MEIRVLGELEVLAAGRRLGPTDLGGRKPKQLLEVLTVARGHPVPKDTLIERLWSGQPPRHPVAALENHVWVLRRHLLDGSAPDEPPVIATSGAYRLAMERTTVDLIEFDTLLQQAHGADHRQARKYWEAAIAYARGELLEDEPYAEWVGPLRETYRLRVANLRLDLAQAVLLEGDPEVAVEHASRVLDGDPLSERACRLKMLGLAQRGERVQALQLFGSFSESLRAELGIEPLAETRAVYEAVRAGTTAAPRPAPGSGLAARADEGASVGVGAPPGVAGASRSDPGLVGRVAELGELVEEVLCGGEGRYRLILVEGLAHVGKSRLVREVLARCPSVSQGWVSSALPSRGLPSLLLLAALREATGATAELPRAGRGLAAIDLVCREARRLAPLALVLDDLHRADLRAIRSLSHIQLNCPEVPLVVIGVFRSEEVPYDHPLRALRPTRHLRLEPLSIDELRALGGAVALARTGGYGAYLPAWLAGERTGAPTGDLLAAVLGRCEAAGPVAQRILVAASVLSEPFLPAEVADATGLPIRHVAERLDRLVHRGLLQDFGSPGFAFSATLVSDALRSQISTARLELIRRHPR
jgi:DNA-binding SARP family transcriptional activator